MDARPRDGEILTGLTTQRHAGWRAFRGMEPTRPGADASLVSCGCTVAWATSMVARAGMESVARTRAPSLLPAARTQHRASLLRHKGSIERHLERYDQIAE